MKFKALSIVFPGGQKIASGQKTIEVRSWLPPEDLNGDLLIVENQKYLRQEDEIDPAGKAVALVRIKGVREFVEADIPAACATRWVPGYYSWELTDLRPLSCDEQVLAARGIYEVELKAEPLD
jgi:hypothetical protein